MADTALILEGGGMRGTFTAGVLDYLMERGFPLRDVYGVSAGACLGCSYLCGQVGRGLRVWTNYIDDKRYCSMESLRRTGDLFGAEFNYKLIPFELDPLDYDAFDRNPSRFVAVVTNVETGRAEYIRIDDLAAGIPVVQASASLPLISNIQVIDGKKYLDGGIADSIPLQKSIDDGHRRNVVILTQAAGYRKRPNRAMPLIALRYRKCPAFVEAVRRRHDMYNAALELIAREEAAGRVFVIRPDAPPEVGRVERDAEKLRALHAAGYAVGKREYDRLMAFLTGKKA